LAQIQVDGSHHELGFQNPLSFCGGQDCTRVFLRKTVSDAVNPIVVIDVPHLGLQVLYDGKNVRVWTEKGQWKGKLCGLCGNNDDETEDEFVGPAECIYEDAEDFVNSYSMGGEQCEEAERPRGKVWCPKHPKSPAQQAARIGRIIDDLHKQVDTVPASVRRGYSAVAQIQQQPRQQIARQIARIVEQQQIQHQPIHQACQRMATRVLTRGEVTCFSTKPVMQCAPECQIQSQRNLMTEFHCLPTTSPFAKQLIVDAQRKVLKQLLNKRVDIREQFEVPVACVVAA